MDGWWGNQVGLRYGATDELGFRNGVTHLLLRFARDCFAPVGDRS